MSVSITHDRVARAGWHPVVRTETLETGTLHAVRLLEEDVLVWRGANGLHAWQDLCIHRGVKLSLGRVENGCQLRCPYHGRTYDEDGRCLHMPAHPSLKPPARARAGTAGPRA
jgi:Phenylpropionate dioxygenase and related ring-hydroxylating dioxygenases, large terminal subunit